MRTMKFRKLAVLAAAALIFASCTDPSTWSAGPSPLDTPETFVKPPPSMGYFGPHSEYYSRESIHRAANP